jgi:hypothetical protein
LRSTALRSFLAAAVKLQKLLELCSEDKLGICVLSGRSRTGFYLAQSRNFGGRIAKDCDDSAGLPVDVDECDLRKIKGHGLIERDGSRYAYRLTSKGFQVALLSLFFHKRLCGPLANSCFHHQPDTDHRPKSKLEAAYYKADRAIQDIVNLLDAA